jgi:hypothetical protein
MLLPPGFCAAECAPSGKVGTCPGAAVMDVGDGGRGGPVAPFHLPEWISVVPTPSEFVNVLTHTEAGAPTRKCLWFSNLYRLRLPDSAHAIYGRHLRVADDPDARYLEGVLLAYSLRFRASDLDRPGVLFEPAYLPGTGNDAAAAPEDGVIADNVLPSVPLGWYMPFARLPKAVSIASTRVPGGYDLATAVANHPVITGARWFQPVDVGLPRDARLQESGLAFVVYRGGDGGGGDDDVVTLFARPAFTDAWEASVAAIRTSAVPFAVANSPYGAVTVVGTFTYAVAVGIDDLPDGCSPIVLDMAPPTPGDTVPIVAVKVAVVAGATDTARDDLVTRFMYDMMLARPELAVVPPAACARLVTYTDKSGLQGAHVAARGVQGTAPPLPVAPTPWLPRAAALSNPLIVDWLRGPGSQYDLSGVGLSLYAPRTKARTTRVAGTDHTWPIVGALVRQLAEEQYGPGAVDRVLGALYAPLYNVAHNGLWSDVGRWSKPGATRREVRTAYGVNMRGLHDALGWSLYPGFACEVDDDEPRLVRTWALKQLAELEAHWALRYGRVQRPLLDNRSRKVRVDFELNARNYVHWPAQRLAALRLGSLAPMMVSVMNAYPVTSLVLGSRAGDWVPPPTEPTAAAAKKRAAVEPADGYANILYGALEVPAPSAKKPCTSQFWASASC